MKRGVAVLRELDVNPMSVGMVLRRELDEHEFFLLRVSNAAADFLSMCEGLDRIPIYLKSVLRVKKLHKGEIGYEHLIAYHAENYIIRTQCLLDRALRLVDAVFHLTHEDRHIRFDTVSQNLRVSRTRTPKDLRRVKKVLEKYSRTRNEIIHQHSLKEDPLRRLEFLSIAERWEELEGVANLGIVRRLAIKLAKEKMEEFTKFNLELERVICPLVDGLEPHFKETELMLRKKLDK
jgi:hypothetical protein